MTLVAGVADGCSAQGLLWLIPVMLCEAARYLIHSFTAAPERSQPSLFHFPPCLMNVSSDLEGVEADSARHVSVTCAQC